MRRACHPRSSSPTRCAWLSRLQSPNTATSPGAPIDDVTHQSHGWLVRGQVPIEQLIGIVVTFSVGGNDYFNPLMHGFQLELSQQISQQNHRADIPQLFNTHSMSRFPRIQRTLCPSRWPVQPCEPPSRRRCLPAGSTLVERTSRKNKLVLWGGDRTAATTTPARISSFCGWSPGKCVLR